MIKLEVNPDVFGTFVFYAAILVGKTLLMSLLTARQRFSKHVFANPEDAAMEPKIAKVKYDDPDVERVRRAHMNDLENILPFLITGLLYCFTSPEFATAKLVFRIFSAARFLHTFVYAILPLPQPSRALSWGVGYAVNFFMLFKIVCHFV